mmetsp:Transcript_11527/g.26753  ORF Transcript_11527/g.26753 Transcript_11527/m.26753 type:complete len:321 (+) Transcript_11527:89-1051(+)
MGAACGGCFEAFAPPSAKVTDLRKAKEEIKELVNKINCGPILIRLAWHDSGTFDQRISEFPQRGGANGGIRFDPELTMGANAGLDKAKRYLEKIAEKYPSISWADLIQLGSATAVEVMGGPKIPMKYGRVSITSPSECAGPKSREGFAGNAGLPDAMAPYGCGASDAATHLRNVFSKKMGFTDQEIVALSGAHTVGRAFKERSGTCPFGYGPQSAAKYTKDDCVARKDGTPGVGMVGGASWTKNWLTFDNAYFSKWVESRDDDNLLWFPTDDALFLDPGFKPFAEKYKADQAAFFADYAKAHKKLSELGVKWDSDGAFSI